MYFFGRILYRTKFFITSNFCIEYQDKNQETNNHDFALHAMQNSV